jgi:hypothetical protein
MLCSPNLLTLIHVRPIVLNVDDLAQDVHTMKIMPHRHETQIALRLLLERGVSSFHPGVPFPLRICGHSAQREGPPKVHQAQD